MTKINEDITLLKNFMTSKNTDSSINNITTRKFLSEDKIYPFTNETLYSSFPKKLDDKKSLVVTSSGDHVLHAVLAGSKDITAFDINRFCKYYVALKIAMIKKYDYKKFYKNIFEFVDECTINLFDFSFLNSLFEDLLPYLSDSDRLFWDEYLKIIRENDNLSCKLLRPCFSPDCTSYRKIREYDKLKNKLDGACITYIDSDIGSLSTSLNKKYGYINISNILEYASNENKEKVLLSLESLLEDEAYIDAMIYNCPEILLNGVFDVYEADELDCDDLEVYRFTKK